MDIERLHRGRGVYLQRVLLPLVRQKITVWAHPDKPAIRGAKALAEEVAEQRERSPDIRPVGGRGAGVDQYGWEALGRGRLVRPVRRTAELAGYLFLEPG
jgi:hypothetical protein